MLLLLMAMSPIVIFAYQARPFHLTTPQLKAVHRLVRHTELTEIQRSTLNRVLYAAYEKWAVKKAKDFQKFHRNKCRHLAEEDLVLVGKIGLWKAVTRFNGRQPLLHYASLYVKGELCQLLTSQYKGSIVPRKRRIESKQNYTRAELDDYNDKLGQCVIEYRDFNQFSQVGSTKHDDRAPKALLNVIKKEELEHVWLAVSTLTPTQKIAMHLKYNYALEKQRTNHQLALELGCCQETARTIVKTALYQVSVALSAGPFLENIQYQTPSVIPF